MPRRRKGMAAELVRELSAGALDDDAHQSPACGRVVLEVTDYTRHAHTTAAAGRYGAGGAGGRPAFARAAEMQEPPPATQEFSMDLLFRSSPPTSPAPPPIGRVERRVSSSALGLGNAERRKSGAAHCDAGAGAGLPAGRTADVRDCWDSADDGADDDGADADDAAAAAAAASVSGAFGVPVGGRSHAGSARSSIGSSCGGGGARSLPRAVPVASAPVRAPRGSGGAAGSGLGRERQAGVPPPRAQPANQRPANGGGGGGGGSSGNLGAARRGSNGPTTPCSAPPALCAALDELLPALLGRRAYSPLAWPSPPTSVDMCALPQLAHGVAGMADGGAQLRAWADTIEAHRRAVDLYFAHQVRSLRFAAEHRPSADAAGVAAAAAGGAAAARIATQRLDGTLMLPPAIMTSADPTNAPHDGGGSTDGDDAPLSDESGGDDEADERELSLASVRASCSAALPPADAEAEGASAPAREKLCGRSSLADFEIVRQIGSGGFGKVYEVVRRRDGSRWAMKALCKRSLAAKKAALQDVAAEHAVLTQYAEAAHPFIVTLASAFQTPSKLFLVMELLPGGQLFGLLQREAFLPERHAAFYAGEVALALGHLHAHGVVHRDLKPENVLLRADGHVCLTDFGLSKMGVTQRAHGASSFCGTVEYMAPEMVADSRADRQYGQAVDLWALGVLLYQLLTGEVPFVAPNQRELVRKIRAAKPKWPPHVSQMAKGLLRALLVPAPDERMALPALQAHPFFSSLDWAELHAKAHPPPFLPPHDALERSAAGAAHAAGGGNGGKGARAKGGKGGEGGLKLPANGREPNFCLSPSPCLEPLPSEFAHALEALRFSYEGPTSAWLPLAKAQLSPPPAAQSAEAGGAAGGAPAEHSALRTPSLAQQLAALGLAGAAHAGNGPAAAGGGSSAGGSAGNVHGSPPPDDRPADAGLLGGPAKGAHARASGHSLSLAIKI